MCSLITPLSALDRLLPSAKAIPFNTHMTKAILDLRKTQTRRALKPKNSNLIFRNFQGGLESKLCALFDNREDHENGAEYIFECVPLRFKTGDILWVREPAKVLSHSFDKNSEKFDTLIQYLADSSTRKLNNFDEKFKDKNWFKNCKGIPNGCTRNVARILLQVTSVRVEKLNDMSPEDTFKEGSSPEQWVSLWDGTSSIGYKIKDNPYVLVTDFKVITI